MALEPQAIDARVGLAPGTLILVNPTGLFYASPTMTEPAGIGMAGLALLSLLRRGTYADATAVIEQVHVDLGTEKPWLTMLMKSFTTNGLVVTAGAGSDSTTPASDATAADRPAPEPPGPAHRRDEKYFLPTPLTFLPTEGGFATFDRHGHALAVLSPVELVAAAELREPRLIADALASHQAGQGAQALDTEQFDALISRLQRARLVRIYDPSAPSDIAALGLSRAFREEHDVLSRLRESLRNELDRHEAAEATRREASGRRRVRVVPVADNGVVPPLALGLITAYAKVYRDGVLDEHYDFLPTWLLDDEQLAHLAEQPGVFLFSSYIWSFEKCLAASELVKQVNPANITIHGGPSVPKYELDNREFFRRYPHVDVTVRGEGELTAADVLDQLRSVELGASPPDLSVLRDVPGISFRDGTKVVRTPDRDRMKDLDEIPSPYLSGLFDAYLGPGLSVTLETNRGCPYGCTFCDWGSATLSRIRKFDLDRVFAEFEWCASNGVHSIGLADANFGIWSRDVEIVKHLVDLKSRYGSPRSFNTNLAKNTVKHTKQIIQMVIEAGMTTQAYLAIQTMDAATLEAIDRSNISLEKYEELAAEFRKAGLPLIVDIMVGLPGQTIDSFRRDLQECVDREVDVSLADTELLVNSPMNEPSYRENYKIEVSTAAIESERSLVVSSTSFTRAERQQMDETGKRFDFVEYLGVLRHVARYVRQETGCLEVDFYDRLATDVARQTDRWPALAFALAHGPRTPMAPGSWRFLVDDVHDYLTTVLSMPDDSSLETVLAVQHALLPDRMREFPATIDVAHDYTAWHARMVEVKDSGHRADWPERVPHLREFGPSTFTINRATIEIPGWRLHFEMDSPVSRARSSTRVDLLEQISADA